MSPSLTPPWTYIAGWVCLGEREANFHLRVLDYPQYNALHKPHHSLMLGQMYLREKNFFFEF